MGETEQKEMLVERIVHILQIQDEDGQFRDFLTPRADRDEITMIQVHRAKEYPEERRRVLTKATYIWVDEVEGDGEGETSREDLFARNDENTKRRLAEEDASKSEAQRKLRHALEGKQPAT